MISSTKGQIQVAQVALLGFDDKLYTEIHLPRLKALIWHIDK